MTGNLRSLRLLSLGGVAGVLLAACAGGTTTTTSGSPKSGGSVTVASWQEPDTLLAAGVTDSMTHAYADVGPAMEGLLRAKAVVDVPKNPKISDYWEPQLATNVPTVENGDVKVNGTTMDVTWKLRHGVKWHDGMPFTSKDVKSTFDFWWVKYKDKNPTPVISTSGWDQVSGVDTPDDFTAVVHWKSIFGPYIAFGAGPYGILPDHLLQQVWAKSGDITKEKLSIAIPGGFNGTDTWDKWMVGTGPFMFKEWVTGDHLTMVKNPHWWGSHQPYLDTITVKFEPDTNTQLADLRTNTIDMGLDFRAALLSPLSHLDAVTTTILPDSGAEKIDLNLHNAFLQDKAVRQAILMGIDRQKIVDTLLESKTTVPPDSWLCLGTGGWCQDPSATHTKFDPAAAQTLLTNAGYKVDKDKCGGMRSSPAGAPTNGKCLEVKLVTTSGNALREQQEVVIASDLKLIGVKVTQPFNNPRAGKLFGSYSNGGTLYTHVFDMAMYTNTYSGPAEPDAFYAGYVSSQIPSDANQGQGQNDTFTNDARVDAAFNKGRVAVAQADRKQAYVDAQKALADIIPEIPLYQQLTVIAYNKKLQGFKGNDFFWMNNAEDWYVSS
ncbi:MAG TPA: peptide ABC transporter substrate-binding protein [Candidatus Eisenbacteria bacterium]|nr:peptide ABC transporter substrate-binding protein [Candidatus Eisenbacteria bacterium]